MRFRRWKTRLRGWRWAIILSILMAFVVLGITLFLNSFYSYNLNEYNPKDHTRGELLNRE